MPAVGKTGEVVDCTGTVGEEEDSGLTSLRRESNHLEDLLWDPFGLNSIGLFQGRRVMLVIAHNLCRSTCQPHVPYTI